MEIEILCTFLLATLNTIFPLNSWMKNTPTCMGQIDSDVVYQIPKQHFLRTWCSWTYGSRKQKHLQQWCGSHNTLCSSPPRKLKGEFLWDYNIWLQTKSIKLGTQWWAISRSNDMKHFGNHTNKGMVGFIITKSCNLQQKIWV